MVVNGVRLHVEEEGSGPEAIVFSHGMLRTSRMFDPQVAVLRDRYRCIRYDHRGQGASESPQDAVIDLETVYDDAVALIEALDIAPCHWVGLSMGGMVGIRLAARRPELLRSVSLIETSAERDEPLIALRGRASLLVRRILGPRLGAKALAGPTMRLFYGRTFRRDPARREQYAAERASVEQAIRATSPGVVAGVLSRGPVSHELHTVRLPALIIVGDEDVPIRPKQARGLAAAIPGARFEIVPGAGHTSTVEQPGAVTNLIQDFLLAISR